jgi:hypothetical protein
MEFGAETQVIVRVRVGVRVRLGYWREGCGCRSEG